ncbi:hypothetical protein STPYR_11395 [uncultured Stenotrophomonas sp.]|uniref:NAD(P)H-hydrate epimerase n=1 Tax=uncultured Stenotrophomonas sp. TaxID=165438 RepID=A0A1Y5Q6U6_9GAMM|nr:hypothetical protein STPYR_11395 [uncultured Stenotrophomonas sp.]
MNPPAELFDTAAARRIDAQATAALGGDGYVLMQRAGQAAWQCVLQHWPQAQRIVVACGPGNNGGDGYVLARLARQSGREVRVLHLPDDAPRTPLAQRACTDYLAVGGQVELSSDCLENAELVVDALFGIGLSRAPAATAAALIEAINAAGAPVLALDVPSGVDADEAVDDDVRGTGRCWRWMYPAASMPTAARCRVWRCMPRARCSSSWRIAGCIPAMRWSMPGNACWTGWTFPPQRSPVSWPRHRAGAGRYCPACCRRAVPTRTRANPATCCAWAATTAAVAR